MGQKNPQGSVTIMNSRSHNENKRGCKVYGYKAAWSFDCRTSGQVLFVRWWRIYL